jgi:Family of unknown function (DUF6527)
MMKWFCGLLARLAPRWFKRKRYTGIRVLERVSEVPEDTDSLIFIVRRNGNPLWAVLDCPCRRGHRLSVNLRVNDNPHWTIREEGPFVTIHPSLWYKDECRSHFWITKNEVKWV